MLAPLFIWGGVQGQNGQWPISAQSGLPDCKTLTNSKSHHAASATSLLLHYVVQNLQECRLCPWSAGWKEDLLSLESLGGHWHLHCSWVWCYNTRWPAQALVRRMLMIWKLNSRSKTSRLQLYSLQSIKKFLSQSCKREPIFAIGNRNVQNKTKNLHQFNF